MSARITTTLLVFMIIANGTVTIMETSGLSEDLGVELAPGISETIDNLIDDMKEGFSPESGLGQTLFTLFTAAGKLFKILVQSLYAFPTMMMNLGFPDWMVTAFFAPAYMLSTLEIMFIITGRSAV